MRFDNPKEIWTDSTGTALVRPDGGTYSPGLGVYVYNGGALTKWRRRYGEAISRNVNVALIGDSVAYGTGATGGGSVDETAALYGIEGRLRTLLNAPLGTKGGGYMCARDTRVVASGGNNLVGYGPLFSNSHSNSRALQSSGNTLTFSLPGGTAFDFYVWEDYAASYGRTASQFSYNVDAAGAVTVSGSQTSGSANLQRIITGPTGLSDAAHSVVLTWIAQNTAIHGLFWKYATGVSVTKYAVGGFTSYDLLGRGLSGGVTGAGALRVQDATYKTPPMDLAIILVGHNDCSQQVTQGTTPAQYKTDLQQIITLLGTNPAAPPILLLSDPDTSISPPSTYLYSDYWPKIKELASENSNVAALVWAEVMGGYAVGSAEGVYSDVLHQNNTGYARMARVLSVLLAD